MINDPIFQLPKTAIVRLFDNPIPAEDPARADAPEWARELNDIVVTLGLYCENNKLFLGVSTQDSTGAPQYTAIQIYPSELVE